MAIDRIIQSLQGFVDSSRLVLQERRDYFTSVALYAAVRAFDGISTSFLYHEYGSMQGETNSLLRTSVQNHGLYTGFAIASLPILASFLAAPYLDDIPLPAEKLNDLSWSNWFNKRKGTIIAFWPYTLLCLCAAVDNLRHYLFLRGL